MNTKRNLITVGVTVLLAGVFGFAQEQREVRDIPTKPFKIIGNIYYVGVTAPDGKGTQDSVAYLITTPQGHILLDTQYDDTVPLIRDNMQKLSFRVQDLG